MEVTDAADLGGEVDALLEALEDPVRALLVRQVLTDELGARRGGRLRLREVVDDRDIVAASDELRDDLAPDEPTAARDDDALAQGLTPPPRGARF
jgi:hypothetical protein